MAGKGAVTHQSIEKPAVGLQRKGFLVNATYGYQV